MPATKNTAPWRPFSGSATAKVPIPISPMPTTRSTTAAHTVFQFSLTFGWFQQYIDCEASTYSCMRESESRDVVSSVHLYVLLKDKEVQYIFFLITRVVDYIIIEIT